MEQFDEAIGYFEKLYSRISKENPQCNYHFFIHKIDNDGFATLDKKTCKTIFLENGNILTNLLN